MWKRRRRVVYTCLFGFSEKFTDPKYIASKNTDFICFTDDPDLRSTFWEVRLVKPWLLDPARISKTFKALPHHFLREYEASLYVDNTVAITAPIDDVFSHLENQSHDLFCFKHPYRNCIYDEADVVMKAAYDDSETVTRQMNFYRSIGYPAQNGLIAGGFLLRRHRSARLQPVMEEWQRQIIRFSKRDQLSYNVCAWFHNFSWGHFAGDLKNYRMASTKRHYQNTT